MTRAVMWSADPRCRSGYCIPLFIDHPWTGWALVWVSAFVLLAFLLVGWLNR